MDDNEKMNKFIESGNQEIVFKLAMNTMAAMNEFFVNPITKESLEGKSMTFKHFMELQQKEWRKIKETYALE